jgi:integrase/recombinase XerC
MDSIGSLHPLAKTWLLDGPLSPYVDAFVALMERGRYAEGTVTTDLRALAHFAHWMTRCRLAADQIDESLVEQFLDSHLPRCDCHASALRTHNDLRASLGHLLAVLREQRVIVELPGPSGPIAEELHRYNVHMRDARGLGADTRRNRLAIVAKLLQCKFAGAAIAIGELQPEDVRGFIATELTRVNSVSHATALAATLAGLLPLPVHVRRCVACVARRHRLTGTLEPGLAAARPHAEQVQVLMTIAPRHGRRPLRLLAMVRLALDLGLRVGEIARLELCDIDWRAGTLTLKRTKSAASGRAAAAGGHRPSTGRVPAPRASDLHHADGVRTPARTA